jgi:arabinofuranan 3-O-arabinosyltransferase
LLATCVALSALAFTQSAGFVAADTKLDLTQDPGAFMSRALHQWDAQGFFGTLQNQAYGYLFPVGPFFLLGHEVGFPAWAWQRLWWTVLLCIAFLGMVRLTRLMGMSSPLARWSAGLAFALSARIMTTIGPISVESLPYALAPWVLIPLVALRPGRSLRRAAATSALAVALMGGINAAAVAAGAAVGVAWILTETPRPVRVRLLGWWVLCVALATAWFVGPLLLLGRYSPPFLDWIESSAVTTSITDGSAALRGVTDWVAYVAVGGGPQWPAGWQLISERMLILATAVVAVGAVTGLVLRGTRHRRFLVVSVCVGLAAMVGPHVSAAGWPADGVLAPTARWLLDGVLSPLRNVHKFDLWVRLPFAVGVGWSVAALSRSLRAALHRRGPLPERPTFRQWFLGWRGAGAAVAIVCLAAGVAGVGAPAFRGDLTTGRTFVAVPGYWLEVAGWLSANSGQGRALVVPGASYGAYLWGEPRDEPLQPFASSPWAVRDAVPMSSAGNIRALDAVEQLLSDGRGDPGLAAYLARMGVSYLVVRNDLDLAAVGAPRPVLVHQALASSGGFAPAVAFGPLLAGYSATDVVADGGIDAAYSAVEIFRVGAQPPDPRVVLRDASSPRLLVGESEGLLGAAAWPGALFRAGDLPKDGSIRAADALVTDSARRWEVDFGRVHDHSSSTLASDAPWRLPRRVHDYDVSPASPRPTVFYPGGVSVTASSSRGDAAALTIDPPAGPWNAVDRRAETAWLPRSTGNGAWWAIESRRPVAFGGARLLLAASPSDVAGTVTVDLSTEAASRQVVVPLPSSGIALPSELGTARQLTVKVVGSTLPAGSVAGIAELAVPELSTSRSLALPTPGSPAREVVLRTRDGRRSECVVKVPAACYPPLGRLGEEDVVLDRTVTTDGVRGPLELTVWPRGGSGLDALLELPGAAARASASSTWTREPVGRPQAAVDRDPSTAWWASSADRRPTLTVTLARPTVLSWLRIEETPGLAASRPLEVTVTVGSRAYPVSSDERGYLRFPSTLTSAVTLAVDSSRPQLSYDTQTGTRSVLPIGISELVLGEADSQRREVPRSTIVQVPCGAGPTVRVGADRRVLTQIDTTVGALLDGAPSRARSCSSSVLPAGTQRVVARSTAEFWVGALRWPDAQAPAPDTPVTSPRVVSWSSTRRVVEVPPASSARTLELAENANAGWTATWDGATLTAVRVDGWRQAWLLPPGASGTVQISYAPDRLFQGSLAVGLLALLGVLLLAVIPAGRQRSWSPEVPRPVGAASRLLGVGTVGLVVLGPAGAATALAASRLKGSTRRARMASLGVLVAVAGALSSPWPASTSWQPSVAAAVAILTSASTGVVLGCLVGPGRARRRCHETAGPAEM